MMSTMLAQVLWLLCAGYCLQTSIAEDPSVCLLCPDGTPMPSEALDNVVFPAEEDFGVVVNPATTCADVVRISTTSVGIASCDSLQVAAAGKCQCPPPQNISCPICAASGKALPADLDAVIEGFLTASRTCFDLAVEAAESRSDDECASSQSFGVLFCGCSPEDDEGGDGSSTDGGNEEPESECKLCQDGSDPILSNESFFPGATCDFLQAAARTVSSASCGAFQATAGLYCGCRDYNVTEESEDFCRLCGPRQVLPSPSRAVQLLNDKNESTQFSCGEIELEVNAQETLDSLNAAVAAVLQNCTTVRDAVGDICCQPDPTAAPTQFPSTIPSEGPSFNPSAVPSTSPTTMPSNSPSAIPSTKPSQKPSALPSTEPSRLPTALPTMKPSSLPSPLPTSSLPSPLPTSSSPTTMIPTMEGQAPPTIQPTIQPTVFEEPTAVPVANSGNRSGEATSGAFKSLNRINSSVIAWALGMVTFLLV